MKGLNKTGGVGSFQHHRSKNTLTHMNSFLKVDIHQDGLLARLTKVQLLVKVLLLSFFDDYAIFAVLQSFLHEDWSREFGSTLGKEGHRYTNTCIETFPFPDCDNNEKMNNARKVAAQHLKLRNEVCSALDCTINKLHEFVDDEDDTRKEVEDYRKSIVELDLSVLRLYDLPTSNYSRIHCKKTNRFYPQSEFVETCFSHLLNLNNTR